MRAPWLLSLSRLESQLDEIITTMAPTGAFVKLSVRSVFEEGVWYFEEGGMVI